MATHGHYFHTDRQTDRQIDTHTHMCVCVCVNMQGTRCASQLLQLLLLLFSSSVPLLIIFTVTAYICIHRGLDVQHGIPCCTSGLDVQHGSHAHYFYYTILCTICFSSIFFLYSRVYYYQSVCTDFFFSFLYFFSL
jgi:hypothetical protein